MAIVLFGQYLVTMHAINSDDKHKCIESMKTQIIFTTQIVEYLFSLYIPSLPVSLDLHLFLTSWHLENRDQAKINALKRNLANIVYYNHMSYIHNQRLHWWSPQKWVTTDFQRKKATRTL